MNTECAGISRAIRLNRPQHECGQLRLRNVWLSHLRGAQAEEGGTGFSLSCLHSEFQAKLGDMGPCLKITPKPQQQY